MKHLLTKPHFAFLLLLGLISCKIKDKKISPEDIQAINLKKGEPVLCGPPEQHFGTVAFETSCPQEVKKDFNLAVALLHSFEYDEAEKVFARMIEAAPACAMAYWGVAMCSYHPLWTAPGQAELIKGAKAIDIAESLGSTAREKGYIEAIAQFYKDWDKIDHHTRSIKFEKGMEKVYLQYPQDKEAAIFYALALDAAADPTDKSYANQKKAGAILTAVYPREPNHPGIVHYLIHSYDYPGLAVMALPAARQYASIAPSSAHALHMPSHIFTRLGLWDECISSNLVSVAAAQCYAENAGMKGHWDEELHSLDYLVYGYLQKGEMDSAKAQWNYLKTIEKVYPENFKVAYAYAAIPSRYLLENSMWKEAAHMEIRPAGFPWEKFPWQKAIIHFTRILGDVHTGNMDSAKSELAKLNVIYDTLMAEKDQYKANQVRIQITSAEAWMSFKQGKKDEALKLMRAAADMEDATEKHPVTPGAVIPARELLGDMLMEVSDPSEALAAYQADLKTNPNRFNELYGAGLAAEKSKDPIKAGNYYQQLLAISSTNSTRPELAAAKLFLKRN